MPELRERADGLSREAIRGVVIEFYGRIRDDAELGPIFERRLAGRWPEHLDRMCEFWSTVLLGARSYRGDPMGSHRNIEGLDASHFTRWMDLFAEVARARLTEPAAADIIGRAQRMRAAIAATVLPDSASPARHPSTTPLPIRPDTP